MPYIQHFIFGARVAIHHSGRQGESPKSRPYVSSLRSTALVGAICAVVTRLNTMGVILPSTTLWRFGTFTHIKSTGNFGTLSTPNRLSAHQFNNVISAPELPWLWRLFETGHPDSSARKAWYRCPSLTQVLWVTS